METQCYRGDGTILFVCFPRTEVVLRFQKLKKNIQLALATCLEKVRH